MRYTDFDEKMLLALYQETERTDDDVFTFKELCERYGLPMNTKWVVRLAEQWEHEGNAKVRKHIGNPETWRVEITGSGLRWIEDNFGSKEGVGQILEPVAREEEKLSEPISGSEELPHVDSSSWTGLRKHRITSHNRESVRIRIVEAKAALDTQNFTNEQKAQAVSFLRAAEELIEAPEPPSDIIWELVERAGAIAGIAGLFLSIFLAAVS